MIQRAAFSHLRLIILKLAFNYSYKTNARTLICQTPSHNKCTKCTDLSEERLAPNQYNKYIAVEKEDSGKVA